MSETDGVPKRTSYVMLTVRLYEMDDTPETLRMLVENAIRSAVSTDTLGADVEVEIDEHSPTS